MSGNGRRLATAQTGDFGGNAANRKGCPIAYSRKICVAAQNADRIAKSSY